MANLYTLVLQGNLAGFPVRETIVNASSVTPDKNTGTLKVVVGEVTTYLTPQPHENIQVVKQDAEIVTEEKQ